MVYMKRKKLRTILIIVFFLVVDYVLNLYAIETDMNKYLKSFLSTVLIGIFLIVYFKKIKEF